jgi:hypothetical protein
MNKRGKVPISEGKRLCLEYAAPICVVFTLHDGGDSFNVMTYGVTKVLCRYAADIGKQIAEAVLNGTIAPSAEEPKHLPDVPTLWEGTRT